MFLTIWFKPSMAEIEYEGTYQLLRGMPMSEAFASTMSLSFDIRGGLLMRQMHHWAAMLFVAAMLAHSLRIFFTGAFRKPREINWLIGVGMLAIGVIEGFAGYSLPDDLLSGTGLRFVDGLIRSVPIIGTWAEFFVFAGEFPGDLIIPRLYMAHILLIPAVLLGLIAAHLALVVYHKHTQFPGQGRNEGNVVGFPVFPVYMAKAGGFFFIVFGVITLMGGLMQINPVWTYGPYNPAQITAGSQPDWYMGFVEGGIRIMPNWETHIWGTTWSWNVAIPGLGHHGSALRPDGDLPVRRAVGHRRQGRAPHPRPAAERADPDRLRRGGDDCVRPAVDRWRQRHRGHPVQRLAERGDLLPAGRRVRRSGAGLPHHEADLCRPAARRRGATAARLRESGIIVRAPSGEYSEPHAPISTGEAYTLTQHKEHLPLAPGGDQGDLTDAQYRRDQLRRRATRFYFIDDLRKPTRAELEEAAAHAAHGHGRRQRARNSSPATATGTATGMGTATAITTPGSWSRVDEEWRTHAAK